MGVECVLVNPGRTKATSQYRDQTQLLEELREEGARMCNQAKQGGDDISIIENPDDVEESEEEDRPDHNPMEGQLENGAERSHSPLFNQSEDEAERSHFPQFDQSGDEAEERHSRLPSPVHLPSTLKSAVTPLVRSLGERWMETVAALEEERGRQRMEEERRHRSTGAAAGKAKKKTKRNPTPEKKLQRDMHSEPPTLQPLPPRTRKIISQSGVMAIY